MPINPLIASGGTPFDVSNALFKMGDGQRADRAVQVAEERNALVDRRWQAQDAQQQAALAKEAEEDAAIAAAVRRKNKCEAAGLAVTDVFPPAPGSPAPMQPAPKPEEHDEEYEETEAEPPADSNAL